MSTDQAPATPHVMPEPGGGSGHGFGLHRIEAPPARIGLPWQFVVALLLIGPLVGLALVAIGAAVIFLLDNPSLVPWVAASVGAIPFVLLLIAIYAARRRSQQRQTARVAAWENQPPGQIAREAGPNAGNPSQPSRVMIQALNHLYEGRSLRGAVLVGQCDRFGDVKPLVQPFEPRQIDETDESFEALRSAHEEDSTSTTRANPASRDRLAGLVPRVPQRRLQRYVVVVLVVLLCSPAAVDLLRTFLTADRITLLAWSLLCGLAFAAAAWATRTRTGGPTHVHGKWMIVPGGLLVLQRSGSHYLPHALRARDSLLLARQLGGVFTTWLVIVRDATRITYDRLTPAELRMLLAAWLSPAEPPEPEQLSDLAGAADGKE